jgi:hypothetical protein
MIYLYTIHNQSLSQCASSMASRSLSSSPRTSSTSLECPAGNWKITDGCTVYTVSQNLYFSWGKWDKPWHLIPMDTLIYLIFGQTYRTYMLSLRYQIGTLSDVFFCCDRRFQRWKNMGVTGRISRWWPVTYQGNPPERENGRICSHFPGTLW